MGVDAKRQIETLRADTGRDKFIGDWYRHNHPQWINPGKEAPSMTTSPDPRKNQLLAAPPEAELHRWLPHLEYVDMRLAEVLYEAGSTLTHVYFPTSAIVSLLYVMQNGESAEIAVVGNDGVVGIPFARPATVSLAAAELRSPSRHRNGDDAGSNRSYARRAAYRRDRGCPQTTDGRAY
jgi:hypothetical protein